MKDSQKDGSRPSASLVAGAIALVFLIIGYQAAVFIHKASIARIISNHDSPDTVFVAAAEYCEAEYGAAEYGEGEYSGGKSHGKYTGGKSAGAYSKKKARGSTQGHIQRI
jgi:hypothetical protein